MIIRVTLFLVLLGTCSFVSPAQAFYCSRPSEPSLPNGNSSNVGEMNDAESEVSNYLSEMREYIECLNTEASDAASEANSLQDQWNGEVSSFNSQ